MSGYEREFATAVDRRARVRIGYTTRRGAVERFVVQLEYWLDGDWVEVVRYDHDTDGPHDITEDGLHRDVYRDGEKVRTERVTGPIPAGDGFDYAEEDLQANLERFIRRFERWHDPKARDP